MTCLMAVARFGTPLLVNKNEVLFEMRQVFEGWVRASQEVNIRPGDASQGNKAINPTGMVGNNQHRTFRRNI